jgi:hypothetical protein
MGENLVTANAANAPPTLSLAVCGHCHCHAATTFRVAAAAVPQRCPNFPRENCQPPLAVNLTPILTPVESCNFPNRSRAPMAYRNFQDLTGRRFDRWTVIAFAGRNACGGAMWKVRCVCGNTRIVFGPNLTRRQSRSCGCYRKELQGEKFRAALQLLKLIEARQPTS